MHHDSIKPVNEPRHLATQASPARHYSTGVQVFVITASLLLITLSVNLQVPLYNAYAQSAGYGNGLIAVTFAAYVLGLLPVLIMLGGISDRIGRKPTVLLGLLSALLANVLIIVDPAMQTLLIVRVLQGVAVGLTLGAATAYLDEILKNTAQVAGLTAAIVTIGLGSGSLLTSTALLYDYSTVPYSYFGITAATLLCVALMLFMPRSGSLQSRTLIRLPLASKHCIRFCIAIFLAWSLSGVIIATIPAELERLSLTGWSGLLVFLAICTGVFFQPWSRRLSPDRSLAVGYLLSGLAYLILLAGVQFSSLGLILLASACSGASSFGFIYLGGLAAIVDSSGLEKARAVSGYFLFAYLGLGIPCILIGYLSDNTGLFAALAIFGSAIATSAMLFLFVSTRYSTPVEE